MDITLTPELEAALAEQARRQGVTPQQLALDSLRRQFVAVPESERDTTYQGTLADFLADSIGSLHSSEYRSGGARMSDAKGRAFAEHLLKKRQQGRL
jgi:hypothetical protein